MRFDAHRAVLEAVEKADIPERQKRRLRFAMRWRPRVRNEVVAYVTQECHVEGMVSEDGEIEAAIDWDSLISFIERLMPLILQLISLFGG